MSESRLLDNEALEEMPGQPLEEADIQTAEEHEEATLPEEKTIVYSEEKPINKKLVRIRRFVVSFGIFLFLIACLISAFQLRQQALDLDKQIAKIEEQISEEKAKTLEYRVEQNYYKSEQYKEEMARNRFRLIFPGETLIQVN